MIHIGLFSGIGGFELAAEWAGWKNYASCEINPFGQQVLKYYWPDAYHHSDVKTLTYELLNTQLIQRFGTGWRNDDIIVTGGFPCQPYSQAGKRLGKADERHLWPEMLRFISEVKPTWVVGENVRGIINWSDGLVFDEVQTDLEALSYEVQPFLLPAAGVNAPHERYRTWFIAYSEHKRLQITQESKQFEQLFNAKRNNSQNATSNTHCNGHELRGLGKDRSDEIQGISEQEKRERVWSDNRGIGESVATSDTISKRWSQFNNAGKPKNTRRINCQFLSPQNWLNFPTQPPVRGRNDGLSSGLAGITVSKHRNESIKAYGNAIVPQVAYQIFKAINEFNKITT